MKKIKETTAEENITCPYCGEEDNSSWEVGTNVNEGDLGVQQCGSCDKYFTANRNLIITYDSYSAPCLNGECEHNWKPIIGLPKEHFKDKYICKICGTEKISEED